ncbi:MAG TPA: YihY/virulence factor BrkB family protein [Acidimicrobiales bacterium]|nr:YihY/virulence factor BrkB family protein [Acidimicrobiales bacterium]
MPRRVSGNTARVNVVERVSRSADRFQQGHRPLAVVYAVLKKYADDNAGVLVSSLTLSAFGTLFPMLLLLVTILGLVLSSDSTWYRDVLHSTFGHFPIIGNDLAGNIKSLHRNSAVGLVVGAGGLVWGSLGLAQNGIFTMEQVWNLPGPARPNYLKRLGRSFAFLAVLGTGLIVSTVLAAGAPTLKGSLLLAVAGGVLSSVVNFGEYLFGFRVLTPHSVRLSCLVPGAVLAGAGWTVLQAFGGFVVGHYLKNDSAVYGLFGIVLGLLAWVYLIVELTVYAAELNVVLARRLWPRSMVPPPLTDADRKSLAAQAEQNQRRPEQRVEVVFLDQPSNGGGGQGRPPEPARSNAEEPPSGARA